MMNTFCTYYNRNLCRSCDKIELSDQTQVTEKETLLLKELSLPKTFKLEVSQRSPTQGFRNKAKVAITGTIDSPIIGLWGESTLDEGREILNCPVHHPALNEIIGALPEFIRLAKLAPYSISSKTGELKGAICYYSSESHESYLRFVLRSEEAVTRIKKYLPHLLEKFKSLKVVSVNIQSVAHALLEGEKEIVLTENTYLKHQLGNVAINLGTKGFVQTNQLVAKELYRTASQWVTDLSIKRFLELFSGQGAFSFFVAPNVEAALGVEIDSDAVKKANETAIENKLSHLQFKCSDATKVSSDVIGFSPDLILVNPPRRGLAEATDLLEKSEVEYIIYSSCNYKTLASDIKRMPHYEIKMVKMFDMFPHTQHFETLVLLQRL